MEREVTEDVTKTSSNKDSPKKSKSDKSQSGTYDLQSQDKRQRGDD